MECRCSVILYNLLRLIAVVAPLYVIARVSNVSNGISFAEYQLAFSTYISETSGNLQADPEILKLQIVCSVIFSTVYILSSFGLGMRKKIAKNIVVFLLTIEIFVTLVFQLNQGTISSIFLAFTVICILLFLFSPNLAAEYN